MVTSGTDIKKASQLLVSGQLVAIPTETVYGLAANALDEKAVLSIFVAKQRPFFDPLIVHVHSIEQAQLYASIDDERLMALARKYWPGEDAVGKRIKLGPNANGPWISIIGVAVGGREFRAVPTSIQSIENNLSLANMDFVEFAESVDPDGVFREFSA